VKRQPALPRAALSRSLRPHQRCQHVIQGHRIARKKKAYRVKFEVEDDEAVISFSSGAKLHIRARARDICQVDYRVVAKR
jgi:hypothetical protein